MAFKTFAILLLAVTAIANPIAVPDASADAKDILNDNLELEDRTAKIPSCDYSRWAAGGIKAPYKGKFNINYPIREFGPEKPYCTMKVGAKGEGVRSLQRALTKCYKRPTTTPHDTYDAKTKAAVKHVQKLLKMKQDGIWTDALGKKMKWYAMRYDTKRDIVFSCVNKTPVKK